MNRGTRAIVLAVLLAGASVAPAAAETYLPEPTVEDLDALLDPRCDRYRVVQGVRQKCDVRGLTIKAAPQARVAAAKRPSASMPVLFEYDSATLTPQAQAALDKLAAVLGNEKYKTSRFRIIGHTDAAGTREYNLDLSRRRAEAAVAYLTAKHGLPGERLQVVGMGKERLLRPEAPLDGANRRVEVVNEGDPVLSRSWQPGAFGDTNSGTWPEPELGSKIGG